MCVALLRIRRSGAASLPRRSTNVPTLPRRSISIRSLPRSSTPISNSELRRQRGGRNWSLSNKSAERTVSSTLAACSYAQQWYAEQQHSDQQHPVSSGNGVIRPDSIRQRGSLTEYFCGDRQLITRVSEEQSRQRQRACVFFRARHQRPSRHAYAKGDLPLPLRSRQPGST